jgi:hypothetical protein
VYFDDLDQGGAAKERAQEKVENHWREEETENAHEQGSSLGRRLYQTRTPAVEGGPIVGRIHPTQWTDIVSAKRGRGKTDDDTDGGNSPIDEMLHEIDPLCHLPPQLEHQKVEHVEVEREPPERSSHTEKYQKNCCGGQEEKASAERLGSASSPTKGDMG